MFPDRPVKVTPIDKTLEPPEKRIPANRVHKPVNEAAERKGKAPGFTHGRRQAATRLEEEEADELMHQAIRGKSASDFLTEPLESEPPEVSVYIDWQEDDSDYESMECEYID